jgi:hypothetical protein
MKTQQSKLNFGLQKTAVRDKIITHRLEKSLNRYIGREIGR